MPVIIWLRERKESMLHIGGPLHGPEARQEPERADAEEPSQGIDRPVTQVGRQITIG
jgi:hypothetical protein